MFWTSILSYFTDSSRIIAVYALITLIILKESFDNQKVDCMQQTRSKTSTIDANNICKNRILYNFSSLEGYYENDLYEEDLILSSAKLTINLKDFTSDNNYFIVSYLCAVHVIVILSTTAVLPHLLPISFYLINERTSNHFNEWKYFSYSSIYEIFMCF